MNFTYPQPVEGGTEVTYAQLLPQPVDNFLSRIHMLPPLESGAWLMLLQSVPKKQKTLATVVTRRAVLLQQPP